MIGKCVVVSAYQLPELPGVVWVDQMAQLMNHHIIGDGMGCLDYVPIKNQLPMLIAGSPTRLEIAYAHPYWRNSNLILVLNFEPVVAVQVGKRLAAH
jgi:hypothetical protein